MEGQGSKNEATGTWKSALKTFGAIRRKGETEEGMGWLPVCGYDHKTTDYYDKELPNLL